MRLVRWFFSLVERLKPATWSLEEVNHPCVREFLDSQSVTFALIDFADYAACRRRGGASSRARPI